MRELRGNLVHIVALCALVSMAAPAAYACDHLWLVGNELWLSHGDQTRLIASEERGIISPRWAPAGNRVAYGREGVSRPEAVIVSENGSVLRTLAMPPDSPANAIMTVGWRDDRHVFVEGHVNPSTSELIEWDADSGRVVADRFGSWFAVSPNGRLLAQRANVPHGAPPPHDSSTLLINDKVVWPAEGESGYHRFSGGFAWSPDSSRVAFVDSPAGTAEVVVVNAAGGGVTRSAIAGAEGPMELSWPDSSAVVIRAGRAAWRLNAATGRLETMPSPPPLSRSTLDVPSSLRERVGAAKVRAEDSRCKQ